MRGMARRGAGRWIGAALVALGAMAFMAAEASATVSAWNYNGSDNWSNAARWTCGVPNCCGAIADFSTLNINTNRTVTVDINVRVGGLIFADNVNINKDWKLGNAGKVLTLDDACCTPYINVINQSTTIDVAMAGTHGLEKRGAGTLILNAAATYTGTTYVTAGTLALGIDGSIAPGSKIVVANGAVYDTSSYASYTLGGGQSLGGHGHVRGRVNVESAKIVPGAGGALTFDDRLLLKPTSVLEFELGDPTVQGSSDAIVVAGDFLTLDGTLTVASLGGYKPKGGERWHLVTCAGASLVDNGLDLGAMPALAGGLTWDVETSANGTVDLFVVPEPATLTLLALGSVSLAAARRRR
jgi:autotransporter-associated beta strand protein